MEKINSAIFGETRLAAEHEVDVIRRLIAECPVSVFGELNRSLNERGLQIQIKFLDDKIK